MSPNDCSIYSKISQITLDLERVLLQVESYRSLLQHHCNILTASLNIHAIVGARYQAQKLSTSRRDWPSAVFPLVTELADLRVGISEQHYELSQLVQNAPIGRLTRAWTLEEELKALLVRLSHIDSGAKFTTWKFGAIHSRFPPSPTDLLEGEAKTWAGFGRFDADVFVESWIRKHYYKDAQERRRGSFDDNTRADHHDAEERTRNEREERDHFGGQRYDRWDHADDREAREKRFRERQQEEDARHHEQRRRDEEKERQRDAAEREAEYRSRHQQELDSFKQAALEWYRLCEPILEGKHRSLRKFPDPPLFKKCSDADCRHEDKSSACEHTICEAFRFLVRSRGLDIKQASIAFHPDRFACAPEELRAEWSAKATAIFQVLQNMT